MTGRILVAGVGNVFLRDDAFGVEVVRLLAERPQPPGVQIRDYGIRGVHLVYELLDGYDLFVLVDAAPRGEAPGTVSVLEVELPSPEAQPVIDAHSLTPDAIFGLLSSLGGHPGRNLVVACEPAEVDAGMGLSDPVREALPHAVRRGGDPGPGHGGRPASGRAGSGRAGSGRPGSSGRAGVHGGFNPTSG